MSIPPAAPTPAAVPPVRLKNPLWIPPFLGRVPEGVVQSELSLLGAVSLALLFEEYDLAMLTAALKHIAEDLHIAEAQLGGVLGVIRLGALPAFLVIPLADRIGRRRIFLTAVAMSSLCTFATAFAQSAEQFVVLQMLTRTFVVAGSATALVMVTEELPALHRGWAIGMLGALGVTGHGLGAGLFAAINRLPYGWRSLYAFGVIPLLLLGWFARKVPETRRFTEHRELTAREGASAGASVSSLVDLFRESPARALGIALVAFLPAIGLVSAFQFTGYFTQKAHGWAPGHYSLMVILGGAIGIIGNVVAGRLGDRIGRRYVGFVLLLLFPLFATAFYRGPGWLLPIVWIAFVFCAQGGRVIHRALATELFPTAHRGAAAGLFAILETVGAAAGLFLLYAGSHEAGDLAHVIPWLSLVVALGGAVILLFPETRQRELEAISR